MDALRSLAKQPENQKCADCGTASRMSSPWISVTLGAFLCIECTGVHRKLGAHISLMQSLDLDTWSDEQIKEVVSKGGNKKVNEQYVVTNAPTQAQIQATWEIREAYINAKYLKTPYEAPTQISHMSSKGTAGARKVCSGILRILLIAGVKLMAADINGKSDPYVVFTTGGQTVKSKVIPTTLNPVWNETLMLNVPYFEGGSLDVHVWDKDTVGHDDKLGEVSFKLADQLAPGVAVMKILQLDTKGEIHCEFEFTHL